MNEEILLKEIQKDPRKFGEVYEAFYKRIFGYAYRRTTDYDVAKDIAAETFLKAYAGIGKFTWRDVSILHWLYRIATNEINKYFRRRSYRPDSLQKVQEEYGVDLTDYTNAESERIQLEEDLQKYRDFRRVHEVIATLGGKYQDVISLKYFEQKTIGEIALILGKKEGTVKSLLSRGMEKLREHFTGDDNEEG